MVTVAAAGGQSLGLPKGRRQASHRKANNGTTSIGGIHDWREFRVTQSRIVGAGSFVFTSSAFGRAARVAGTTPVGSRTPTLSPRGVANGPRHCAM
jgi:hypothetical protein